MDDKLIRVSDFVYEQLKAIKEKYQHKSFDSVIRYLLSVYYREVIKSEDTVVKR